MKIDECFKIAYIVKTHGLKGEVTFSLMPDCPNILELTSIFVEVRNQLVPHFIEGVSVKGIKAYVKLQDVGSPETADPLTGCSVYLSKDLRPALARGEFYGDEVAGFEVADTVHGVLGVVKEVLETGANRHLIVIYLGKEIMIPLNGPFIQSFSKARKKFTVELPEGFLDI